ncbi:MAG: allantoicase, partial [Pseudonocardia sp.]|nr:allantoicase [Pseudonocardia sp.]
VVAMAELDTSHFVGNAPGWARLRGRDARSTAPDAWVELLPRQRLQPDTRHRFRLPSRAEVTHVRLDVFPDGGMARMRLWGELSGPGRDRLAARWFDLLPAELARRLLVAEAGVSEREAAELVAARPLADRGELPAAVRALAAG